MERYTATKINDGILINANIANIPLRKNTFLVFDKDLFTIRIDTFENYEIQKIFKKIEAENKIHIFENTKELSTGDYIDIYYEEYEFFGYKGVSSREGVIYKNQNFYPQDGLASGDKKTLLRVSEIDEQNIDLEIEEKGAYTVPPDPGTPFISDGGAKIYIDHFYRKSTVKSFQTNLIKNIIYRDDFIVLDLLNPLPKNVKEGLVIVYKILIKTYTDISNLNKDNEYFYIVQNKLPYLNLPFPEIEDDIASKMLEDIFLRIDNKFMQIEKTLVEINNKLENKSNI
jgi:hypothetical protein